MKRAMLLILMCLIPFSALAEDDGMDIKTVCHELNESVLKDLRIAAELDSESDSGMVDYISDSIIVKIKAAVLLDCDCTK